jgi:UDP-N-acetylglucosamine--N-acetylmuramyl-(pentapeptide) pyrophosphoryl-undecaprenol N-acetylglucosamine transferase
VARELAVLAPDVPIKFIGNARGIEASAVPREGYPFVPVASGPWRRGHPLSLLRGVALTARGALEAGRAMRSLPTGAVFSTGGFASAPVLLAAVSLRVPVVLHEPNCVPGLVNRCFGWLAARVTVGASEAARHFPSSRVRVTGVPVRRELMGRNREEARRGFNLDERACVVLVLGGSQGASGINRAVADALPRLASSSIAMNLVWMCGPREYGQYVPVAAGSPVPVRLFGFLDDIGGAYAAADLVVARAGASGLAELLALAKPSILIPFPHAAGDHQMRNAEALEKQGAAVVLPEAGLDGASLADAVWKLAADPLRRAEMGRRAAALGHSGAARDVAREVLSVMKAGRRPADA